MKNSIFFNKTVSLLALSTLLVLPASAQQEGDKDKAPILFVPAYQNINSNENILRLNVSANIPFEVQEAYDWVEVFKKDNKNIYLKFNQNFDSESREAVISIFNTEKKISRHFVVTQAKDNSVDEVPEESHPEFAIFADNLYTTLKPDVTLQQIENLANPFIKSLAYKIFNKTYNTQYRVANYECWLSTKTLAKEWKCGQYDQYAGTTGIHMPANGKVAVIVRGIPEDVPVYLCLRYWYRGQGEGARDAKTQLHNGINVISNTAFPHDALAYIQYYTEKEPIAYDDIKVHFVNGEVNGYITQDMTNEAIKEMCGKAKNKMIDMLSKKVHAVWTAEGLYKYSRSRDGKLGYHQQMSYMDSIITWEQRALGLEKYKRVRKNRTMGYTNFDGGIYSGSQGTAYDVRNEKNHFNMSWVIDGQHSVWGFGHEWGHQHQVAPYFKWTWMTECTNNIMSYYCCILAGIPIWNDRKWYNWYNAFFNDSRNQNGQLIAKTRQYIYDNRSIYRWNPKLYALCEEMKGGKVAALKENPSRAVSYVDFTNTDVGLCAFIKLSDYLWYKGNKDFLPNMYESMRQIDYPMGSQIEKQGFIDKYELLAMAQNKNTNNSIAAYREKYPESCWTKNSYITEQHCHDRDNAVPFIFNYIRKVSRLSGYNLTPWFEKWGFIRQIAFGIDDYGYKYYLMTQDMLDEFYTDMDEMVKNGEIKEMPEGMCDEIFNARNPNVSTPEFPN